ncbi:RNA-directed DNA polymerase, eukaryota, reverse transcriptase zinc-binding domain protein [Tanacetum coccineum]
MLSLKNLLRKVMWQGEIVVLLMRNLLELKDIALSDEMCFFKFKNKDGMKYIIDQSPWIVNGKPLIVQKWDPEVVIEKETSCKIPVWIRLYNVPLEAWSIKGIGAISSRLGRPIRMNQMTTEMCKDGFGRLGYARVLVEVDAGKEYLENVEINYVDAMKKVKMTKWVRVEYSWKPDKCNHYKEFGHTFKFCKAKPISEKSGANQEASANGNKDDSEGFVEVRNRKYKQRSKMGMSNGVQGNKLGYRWNVMNIQQRYVVKQKVSEPNNKEGENGASKSTQNMRKVGQTSKGEKKEGDLAENILPPSMEKIWNVGRKNIVEMRKSANKYVVLSEERNDEEFERDVFWNIRGMSKDLRQNDAKKFIQDEKVNMCAFIETHLKATNIQNVGKRVFRDWNGESNNLVKNDPWVIMGDFNVTMNAAEHSSGSSGKTADMSCCVTKYQECLPKKKVSFRFCNFVADKAEFIDLVKDAWSKDFHGCHMFKLIKKLKNLKRPLKKLSWANGNVFENVKVLNEYVEASKVEMKLLHQKAKIKWLNEGDKNTAFFHGILKSRRSKSRVEFIKDDDGISYEGQDVNKQFVKHFEQFLGKVDNVSSVDGSIFKSTLGNGFTFEFFKKAWDIVGDEVCLAIKEFFRNGKLLGEVNSTLISLIPKTSTPNKVSEFRPIACCNVLYKCISKILTNRIKSGLEKVVHINQSAFIPGRHIQDNILIAQELLRGYNRKNGPKRCAMQIDIQKAYDTVSWSFLEDILGKFGFHRRMVDWIMTCVKSTTFTICLNGELNGFFKGGRGLRQGDPISPYLFTLVMEVFSLIMEKNIEESKVFGYHFGCKELKLSHMCFADDLLVLCKGNRESIKVVKKSLEEFSNVSGLVPNLGKSIIFFGSISERDKLDLLQVMPFKCGKLPVRYLEVPLLAKNPRMYWASVYLLPTTVINDLEKLFKRFLWNAGDSVKGKARVSWKVVCKPKDQGGLGIKSLKQWNEVLMIRQFWKIIEDKNSLWAKWVNRVKLKNKSIWEVKVEKCDSWGWKTMLFIKDKIRNHVCYDIGDGRKASLWYDKSCAMKDLLTTVISRREIYYARLDDNAKVADMINNNQWVWPDGWTEKYTILSNLNGDVNLSSKEDKVLIVPLNAGKKVFSLQSRLGKDLRVQLPYV